MVRQNILRSFPQKTGEERRKIERDFYKHFSDLLIEGIKMFKANKSFFNQQVEIFGLEKIDEDILNGHHVILAMGHHCNWEFTALSLSSKLNSTLTGIYKSINNKAFEKAMLEARSKFGLQLLEMKEAPREMIKMKDKPAAHFFIIDQSPTRSQSDKWITFLNQDTLVFEGVEKMAKMLNAKVYWIKMRKKKFANYSIDILPITTNIKEIATGDVINSCYQNLEQDIKDQPGKWLWSHRRWKHQRN